MLGRGAEMLRNYWAATALVLLVHQPAMAKSDFEIDFKTDVRGSETLNLCQLSFTKDIPPKAVVESLAAGAMAACVKADASKDAMLQVFHNDDLVDSSVFDGAILFNHMTGKITHQKNDEIWKGVKPIKEN